MTCEMCHDCLLGYEAVEGRACLVMGSASAAIGGPSLWGSRTRFVGYGRQSGYGSTALTSGDAFHRSLLADQGHARPLAEPWDAQ